MPYNFSMASLDIVRQRLRNQHLTEAIFKKPGEVVGWLGAVQAQDYAGAKWAVGQRLKGTGITDAVIEQAFTDGAILRTHLLRPTWHFVTPADIRWLLELTAPRVNAVNAYMYRKLELDEAIFKRCNAALTKALQGGQQLMRAEIVKVLEQARIAASGLRFGYLLMRAELDGVICSSARRGKQFTYALLEERAPPAKKLKRDEALFELARRYFATRGPATAQDFVWWSGLTLTDARKGLEMIRSQFESERVGEQTYWFPASGPLPNEAKPTAHLLPNYDEYFIGFRDRSAIGDRVKTSTSEERSTALNAHIIVINGQVVGGWKRTLQKNTAVIETNFITPLTKAENRAVAVAAEKYGAFLELPVVMA